MTSDAEPITTPFGFEATAAEVADGVDLTGRRAIVTGASSGIGIETARALAGAGAVVTLAVRDIAAGERVAGEIIASTGSPVVFDDLDYERRAYDPGEAYGQSKTANVLFAVEATRRWSPEGIFANAVHPGAILESNLSRHMDPDVLERLRSSGRYRYKTLEQGAATSVLLATSPQLAGIGGRYFEHNNQAVVVEDAAAGYAQGSGVASYALDADNARRLWDASEAVLN